MTVGVHGQGGSEEYFNRTMVHAMAGKINRNWEVSGIGRDLKIKRCVKGIAESGRTINYL